MANVFGFTVIHRHFTVKLPPSLTSLQDVKVLEGETCEFKTTVTGIPKPEVEWFLDNKPLGQKLVKVDGSVNSTRFVMSKSCNSQVVVRAKNVAGNCEKKASLIVTGSECILQHLVFIKHMNIDLRN